MLGDEIAEILRLYDHLYKIPHYTFAAITRQLQYITHILPFATIRRQLQYITHILPFAAIRRLLGGNTAITSVFSFLAYSLKYPQYSLFSSLPYIRSSENQISYLRLLDPFVSFGDLVSLDILVVYIV